jgi:hypothetical protein
MPKAKYIAATAAIVALCCAPVVASAADAPGTNVTIGPFSDAQLTAIAKKAASNDETSEAWILHQATKDLKLPKPTPTPTPSPTKTPKPTPTPSPTPPTPAATSTTTNGATLPSQVLDLTNWKVTLPVDSKGASGSSCDPSEISQPALAGFTDQWFKVTPNGQAVVFRANIEGCTTSGSSYPRSELREMTSNGSTEASCPPRRARRP